MLHVALIRALKFTSPIQVRVLMTSPADYIMWLYLQHRKIVFACWKVNTTELYLSPISDMISTNEILDIIFLTDLIESRYLRKAS